MKFESKYKTFIHETAYEYVAYELVAILVRQRWVNCVFICVVSTVPVFGQARLDAGLPINIPISKAVAL